MFKSTSNGSDNKNITITADSVSHIARTVSEVSKEISNYLQVREDNVTERKRISAALETATKLIEADMEKYRLYIDTQYKDKERLYYNAEKMIDKGLNENNVDMLNIGCNLMMGAFNKNPLEGFTSQIDFKSTVSGFFQTDFIKKLGE